MNANLKQLFTAAVAVLVFAVVLLFSSTFFKGLRLDMTEHKLFTLSPGSERIIESIEEPIHLLIQHYKYLALIHPKQFLHSPFLLIQHLRGFQYL